jgi:hypothetical protein
MLTIGLLFSFIVTSLEFYFKAKRRRLLDGVMSFLNFLFTFNSIINFRNQQQLKNVLNMIFILHYVQIVHQVGQPLFMKKKIKIQKKIMMKFLKILI